MANPKRIYWDACVWIALIQQEAVRDEKGKLIEDRFAMCRNVLAAAERDFVEIATATLSYAEVCGPLETRTQGETRIAEFFEVDYILTVNVDRAVGERARTLMMSGFSKLKPADACHLAAAALSNAEEMHTFDAKLLVLDGKIDRADGKKLVICKPGTGTKPGGLLEMLEQSSIEVPLEKPAEAAPPAPAPVAAPVETDGEVKPPPKDEKAIADVSPRKDEPPAQQERQAAPPNPPAKS
ncbi:MAG: PIN domain-containing protein [Xanthobacteraceae bacterium]